MTTTYTKLNKPTTSYTKISSPPKVLFDDQLTAFDANIPFDGDNVTYTKVNKVTNTSYTKVPKAI